MTLFQIFPNVRNLQFLSMFKNHYKTLYIQSALQTSKVIFAHVPNYVSMREEFNEKIKIFSSMQNISYFSYNKEIEKNLKFVTKAEHLVQSEGERIIADRLYECGIDYIYMIP